MITVEFYGVLREVAETDRLQCDFSGGAVEEALSLLCRQIPALAAHLPRLACAVDDEIVSRDAQLGSGATLALLPPVSGG